MAAMAQGRYVIRVRASWHRSGKVPSLGWILEDCTLFTLRQWACVLVCVPLGLTDMSVGVSECVVQQPRSGKKTKMTGKGRFVVVLVAVGGVKLHQGKKYHVSQRCVFGCLSWCRSLSRFLALVRRPLPAVLVLARRYRLHTLHFSCFTPTPRKPHLNSSGSEPWQKNGHRESETRTKGMHFRPASLPEIHAEHRAVRETR